MVRRLTALYSDEVIGVDVIEVELAEPVPAMRSDESKPEDNLSTTIEGHLSRYFAAHGDGTPPPGLYDRILREVEKPLLSLSLIATRGNQIKAAQMLGLNRNTLRKKIRDLEIQVVRGLK